MQYDEAGYRDISVRPHVIFVHKKKRVTRLPGFTLYIYHLSRNYFSLFSM